MAESTVERSAGVIVYRVASRSPPRREYLLLDYGRYWDFPKGHVERGEDDRAAAVRELTEETGIAPEQVELDNGFVKEITYFFRARGRLVRKHVAFFVGQTQVEEREIKISHEHVGFTFLCFEEALAKLKYPTAKNVLNAAEEFLNQT